MAKDKDTGKQLLDAINAHISSQIGGKVSSAAEDEPFEWPSMQEINTLGIKELSPIAEKFSINIEGSKISKIRTLLVAAAAIVEDETDDLEEDDVDALAESLDIEPGKKLSATIKKLKEYFNEEGSADADEEEEEEETPKKKKKVVEEDEDEEEETPKKKKKKSDDDDDDDEEKDEENKPDGVDREEVAKEFDDFPDEDDMTERLEAFNEAADEDDQIEINEKKLEKSYRKLVEQLVDSEGKVAEWGTPYPRDDQAYCCGLPLEETEIKGEEEPVGKCLVTEKMFKVDDEGDFVEVKAKKGKK